MDDKSYVISFILQFEYIINNKYWKFIKNIKVLNSNQTFRSNSNSNK